MNYKNNRNHWVPDELVRKCHLCGLNFTFFQRKHHCRICGHIFCSGCSPIRLPIVAWGVFSRVRMCVNCGRDQVRASGIALEKNLDNGLQVLNDWKNLVISRTISLKREKKILAGLPVIHRPTIWLELAGAFSLINSHPDIYSSLSKEMNEYEEFIQQDITRTIFDEGIDLESFAVRLGNILRAYSNYDKAIGYRQGLNFVTAILLLTIQDEESCFWMLVQIMEHYQLSLFYTQDPTFYRLMTKFEQKLQNLEPEVYARIKSVVEDIWMFPCMWLSPLLANSACNRTNIERLWDIFFVTSLDYLLYVGLSLITLRSSNILQVESYLLCEYLKTIPSTLTEKEVNFVIIHSIRLYSKTSPESTSLLLQELM